MTKDYEELAEELGFKWDTNIWCWVVSPPQLKLFAQLVSRDKDLNYVSSFMEIVHDAVRETRIEEREACAKLCEETHLPDDFITTILAKKIRERGNK